MFPPDLGAFPIGTSTRWATSKPCEFAHAFFDNNVCMLTMIPESKVISEDAITYPGTCEFIIAKDYIMYGI